MCRWNTGSTPSTGSLVLVLGSSLVLVLVVLVLSTDKYGTRTGTDHKNTVAGTEIGYYYLE
jgi:hypothetical protein